MFPVWMSNCYQPEEFGVAQYCVPALTYIALDKWTHTGKVLVLHYIYMSLGYSIWNHSPLAPERFWLKNQCVKSIQIRQKSFQWNPSWEALHFKMFHSNTVFS